jgi:hypothetical protein
MNMTKQLTSQNLNVFFAHGARASLVFENDGHADTFVEEMTFSTQGPLFIPGILYGQRLGDWIRN